MLVLLILRLRSFLPAASMGTVAVAGDGVALLYCAIVLLVLTWIIFCMRVGVRIWRKAWGMDDNWMLVGVVRVHLNMPEQRTRKLIQNPASFLRHSRPLHRLLLLWLRAAL